MQQQAVSQSRSCAYSLTPSRVYCTSASQSPVQSPSSCRPQRVPTYLLPLFFFFLFLSSPRWRVACSRGALFRSGLFIPVLHAATRNHLDCTKRQCETVTAIRESDLCSSHVSDPVREGCETPTWIHTHVCIHTYCLGEAPNLKSEESEGYAR